MFPLSNKEVTAVFVTKKGSTWGMEYELEHGVPSPMPMFIITRSDHIKLTLLAYVCSIVTSKLKVINK